jgi:hypothetical protein
VSNAIIRGRFTLSVQSVLEIQHQVESARGANGYGIAGNFAQEIYTVAEFWKEA